MNPLPVTPRPLPVMLSVAKHLQMRRGGWA